MNNPIDFITDDFIKDIHRELLKEGYCTVEDWRRIINTIVYLDILGRIHANPWITYLHVTKWPGQKAFDDYTIQKLMEVEGIV